MEVVCEASGNEREDLGFNDSVFYTLAAFFAKFNTASFATFKDFDAVVGMGIVGGSNVNGEIKSHLIKTIINSGSWKDASVKIFGA